MWTEILLVVRNRLPKGVRFSYPWFFDWSKRPRNPNSFHTLLCSSEIHRVKRSHPVNRDSQNILKILGSDVFDNQVLFGITQGPSRAYTWQTEK